MKLISLRLKNFKGIRNFTLDAQGCDVSVWGDNATGKSTLFDAFTWLLFDKDSQNKKDFEIKTLGPNGEPVHGLDHEVEAMLEIGGRQLTLRKVFREKWTKKRGSATAEFTGHTTDYFVDGVPVKKGEYEARIAEIADENIFKLLTSPTYFNEQLHWQERRKILLEVCGDISDEEVIISDIRLAMLPGILKGRKLEDHRKVILTRRNEINKELERIPVRIDEAERALLDISTIVPEVLPADIAKLKAAIQKKNQEFARLESGGEIAEKTKRLRELEAELLELKNEHRSKYETKIQEKQALLSQTRGKIIGMETSIKETEKSKAVAQDTLENLRSKIATLREKWYEVDQYEFEYTQDTVCPTCGQALPAEKLQEAREKALAQFNKEKAEQLERITTEGKQIKVQFDGLADEIFNLERKIMETQSELEAEEKTAAQLQKEIEFLRLEQSNYDTSPACVAKLAEIEKIEMDIEKLKENNSEAVSKILKELSSFQHDLEALEEAMLKVKQHEQGLKRIEELKNQERELAAEYERLEKELYLTEQFIRTKVNLLESKINSRFKLARFKLFDVQVNGAVVECCETTYQGVPYSSGLNNGARINVGLDIINVLAEHYSFAPPIFVDNAEAVTQLISTKGQMIRLVVSEADKKLRVEHHEGMKNLIKEAV